jgi:hypothetical protein
MKIKLKKDFKKSQIKLSQKKTSYFNITKQRKAKFMEMHKLSLMLAKRIK